MLSRLCQRVPRAVTRPVVAAAARPSSSSLPVMRRFSAQGGGAGGGSSSSSSSTSAGWGKWGSRIGGLSAVAGTTALASWLGLFGTNTAKASGEAAPTGPYPALPASAANETVVEHPIVFAPNVPPPINRNYPVTLRVHLETVALTAPLTNKYKYPMWTFNGHVPGPFIRARVGDTLEVHHKNSDPSGMPHNIDFHAADGPGGGAPLLLAEMGQTKMARFKLTHPGLFIYHCAAAPVPVHVANGMYGLVLVEPEEGLPKVDKEFYVLQSEFYYDPPESGNEIDECSYGAGLKEQPETVVFNGREGALTQLETLKAKQDEKVRIFFGNAGPNLLSSFHIIGVIFDKVYRDADLVSPPARNLQTAVTAPGGASVVEFSCPVPGIHTLVDHAIFRMDKGAVGFLNISGTPRPELYMGRDPANPCPGCKLHA